MREVFQLGNKLACRLIYLASSWGQTRDTAVRAHPLHVVDFQVDVWVPSSVLLTLLWVQRKSPKWKESDSESISDFLPLRGYSMGPLTPNPGSAYSQRSLYGKHLIIGHGSPGCICYHPHSSQPSTKYYFSKECEFILIITPANLSSFVAWKDHPPGYQVEKCFDYWSLGVTHPSRSPWCE